MKKRHPDKPDGVWEEQWIGSIRGEPEWPRQNGEAQSADHQSGDKRAYELLPTHGREAFDRWRLLPEVFVTRERVETSEPRAQETWLRSARLLWVSIPWTMHTEFPFLCEITLAIVFELRVYFRIVEMIPPTTTIHARTTPTIRIVLYRLAFVRISRSSLSACSGVTKSPVFWLRTNCCVIELTHPFKLHLYFM